MNKKRTYRAMIGALAMVVTVTASARDYSNESLSAEELQAISMMPKELQQMLEHVQPEASESVITLPRPADARLETHLTKAPAFFGPDALPSAVYQTSMPFNDLVKWYRHKLPSTYMKFTAGDGEVLFVDKARAKGKDIARIESTKEILSIPHVRLEPATASDDLFSEPGETEIKLIYQP
ncbi:hypothetical protein [Endozoicomonas sp. ALE010]|uniref:hypothetical protein n=1 Tax=Endozoicomonas TaxID=305899 RepID=UPI003BB7AD90